MRDRDSSSWDHLTFKCALYVALVLLLLLPLLLWREAASAMPASGLARLLAFAAFIVHSYRVYFDGESPFSPGFLISPVQLSTLQVAV